MLICKWILKLNVLGISIIMIASMISLSTTKVENGERSTNSSQFYPEIIIVQEHNLQQTIDNAPPHSILFCNKNKTLTVSETIIIHKPMTIRGLNARLPEKLGNTPLLLVQADHVTITDFELYGNIDSVSQKVRAPLISIQADQFTVERGLFVKSSKEGVSIVGNANGGFVQGGVVRDIVGRGNGRDVVSVDGDHVKQFRNVLIENIRCYNSPYRGAVEVSDGSENITVRKIYAVGSLYAVDVQDHGAPRDVNRNVFIEDVYAVNCKYVIRTALKPRGHSNLTISNVTAKQCFSPLNIKNTNDTILKNVRIIDHKEEANPILIRNCNGLTVRDVIINNSTFKGCAMLIEDCNHVLIDNLALRGEIPNISNAILYRVTLGKIFTGLRISNVFAPRVKNTGILLESTNENGSINDYIISGNITSVQDRIKEKNKLIENNLPYKNDL